MHLHLVGRMVGAVLLGLAGTMIFPAAIAIYDNDWGSATAFGASLGVTGLVAVALISLGRRGPPRALGPREAVGVVGLSWALAGVLGGVPLVLDGAVPSPVDGIFEAVSGFTTTGATVIGDLGQVSRASLFWRSLTHWLGGMGIIVLFVAIFPQLGVGARHLMSSEVPGPITERLRPRMRQTALTLWWIYAALTAALCGLLWLAGMDIFDAANHALATLATGGYSTRNSSVGHYESVAVDVIITVFMMLAGVNFGLYHAALRGKVRAALSDAELRCYLGLYLVCTCFITGAILERHGGDVGTALRYASFQVAAIQTTTGFGTDDFDQYPAAARVMLFVLMFIGGSAGSTAGGMKISRIMVLVRASLRELGRTLRPQEVRALRVGARVVPEGTLRSIAGFATLFAITYVVAVTLLAGCGLDLVTSASAAVAALGNIGPGLAEVGPTRNYGDLPAFAKMILVACMLLGRLEIMTLMAFVLPGAWRRR